MPRSLLPRLRDILDAVVTIQGYVTDIDFAQFQSERMRYEAVIRNFEVMGEATTHIPADIQEKYPEIPWVEMKRTRNVLIHAYHAVRLKTIWQTATQDIAPLVPLLERIIADLTPPEQSTP